MVTGVGKTAEKSYKTHRVYQPPKPQNMNKNLDNKVHGANMGPIWVRQDPGGPHVGSMIFGNNFT